MARILIVDDAALWHIEGRLLLEQAGHSVTSYYVLDPRLYISFYLPETLAQALDGSDALLIDKDFGEGITSARIICVIRHNFPNLPIIRWTAGYESAKKPYMDYLGVTRIRKPNKKNEAGFAKTFADALDEQRLIRSGPMGIFADVDETETVEQHAERLDQRNRQLGNIARIAEMAKEDFISAETHLGVALGLVAKRELANCICDGFLIASDIAPHLPSLQKVIAKLEAAGEIDERFRTCADFIRSGNLAELELYYGCY